MSKNRKRRNLRLKYAVLGEGFTEQLYLKHLKNYKNYRYGIRPSLFDDIGIENAERIIDELLDSGCDRIVFLTDCDTIINQNKRSSFKKFVEKYKDVEEVIICDSMPCIEYWFLLHFIFTTKEFCSYDEVVRELKRYIEDYSKKKVYLEKDKWFRKLIYNNGLERAYSNAKKGVDSLHLNNVGKFFPYTRIYELIDEFESFDRK